MDTLTEIKQKLDIVDVVGSYVAIKKSGRNYKGSCPFHTEKSASFMVSQELQIYKCFGCGEGGDMFKFVQKIEGIDFPSAIEKLAEKAGVEVKKSQIDPNAALRKRIYHVNEVASGLFHHLLLNSRYGKEGLEYVKSKRKLSDEVIEKFRIGYAPDSYDTVYKYLVSKGFDIDDLDKSGLVVRRQSGNGYIDKFRGRVIFPFTEVDGKVCGFIGRTIFNKEPKYLHTAETEVFHKSNFIFGLDKAKLAVKRSGVVFVEGQMDVISCHQVGIDNVVATTGTALAENHFKMISRFTNEVTFCFDSDSAGIHAAYRAVEIAERQDLNIKIASIPKPYKDVDELITALGADAAKKALLQDTVPAYDFFISTSLGRHDRSSGDGKKSIIQELAPLLGKITNSVQKDHYIRLLSQQLGVSEESVADSIGGPQKAPADGHAAYSAASKTPDPTPIIFDAQSIKTNPEYWFLVLILRAGVDTAGELLYKLDVDDFLSDQSRDVFTAMKHCLDEKKDFNTLTISATLTGTSAELLANMALFDEGPHDSDALAKELQDILSRLKKTGLKRRLVELTNQIRIAELGRNYNKIQELTQTAEDIKRQLK